jgi:hypothetical protein
MLMKLKSVMVSRISLVLYKVMMVNIKEVKWVNVPDSVRCDLNGYVCMVCLLNCGNNVVN